MSLRTAMGVSAAKVALEAAAVASSRYWMHKKRMFSSCECIRGMTSCFHGAFVFAFQSAGMILMSVSLLEM